MFELEAYGIVLIPIILGLVEIGKSLGMPKKYSPVVSLILGILAGIVYVHPDNLAAATLVGIALGLAAVGLYSSGKNIVEKE
ncbi:hypothetical protein JOC94_004221 [Bacillus thermophilus]|uniref:Holin n=1 Tax=Siminovitchia thermophila TaxID=1245522 RepID=A0ABS2RF25_9BACI|nr:hypothetical protein [Siminovitchia thermophila]MBM7717196.1 hypothetical protein [Siminovitchia thermophila]